ncbi:ATP-binding cassette domain-containing protein [Corynebacterium macginleyi]|uniref:ATP-binding cassette domain-containing protein n=1 Tax=Corynebacterium macginleyi TaxID=38290 RepID=UPI00190910D8|nr:ATP-binding cassette domain-containing protein [Corynebacterium macginleyi]MBK4178354.1 ABC transporter permease subunit [Corynebacterium macginleyi]
MTPPQPIRLKSPLVIGLIGLIAVVVILVPVASLGLRVPWNRIGEYLAKPEIWDMLKLSLAAAFQSMLLAMVLGTGLALWVQQLGRGSGVIRLLIYLPLAMPPVVGGLALTAAIGRRGYLSPILDAIDFHFAFAFPGVIAAQCFVALPFVVVAVDSALRQLDEEIVASAASVGLSRWEILRKITIPSIAPALATGAGLAFARSLGEFGTTLTFAGSQPGVTRTMPLGIYLEREVDTDGAYVLSAILIAMAIVCLTLAGLPSLLQRSYRAQARALHNMDYEKLSALTAPDHASALSVTADGRTTAFTPRAITAIVGSNGSGKTTLMKRIAGRLTGAQITANQDEIVLLTQHPGLPPRATATQAIAMVTRDKQQATELLEAAGLRELNDVPVPALSGGQAAQVALVRALAARPTILLLDEPLAAIDVESASKWRRFLRATRRHHTTLLVTHNVLDIAGLADDMVVMNSGRVIAHGPAANLLDAPPTNHVATIAGLNRVEGTVTKATATETVVSCGNTTITGCADELRADDKVVVTFKPSDVQLTPNGSTELNHWSTTVIAVEATTMADARLSLDMGGHTITVPVSRETALDIDVGDTVSFSVAKHKISVNQAPQQHSKIRS